MKKWCILMLLTLAALFSGCTLGDTAPQRFRRLALEADLYARDMNEDWDFVWLQERNTYMNRWHARTGF